METKRCIHCGGRLGNAPPRLQDVESLADFEMRSGLSRSASDPAASGEVSLPEETKESETPTGRFGFLRGGMTLVWIVLAALYSILRACGEG